jgi:glycosyltransferase involved in cell wall biosynthesis
MDHKPKRHCMVVFAQYPLGETRVQREAEALLRHGYEVDVICVRLRGQPALDEHRGVRIYRGEYKLGPFPETSALAYQFLAYLRFFVFAMFRVTRLHRQHAYQTVQVHNLPDFLAFSALIPRLLGARIILDLHDLMPEFYAGRFGERNKRFLLSMIRWQERQACRFADHVITVSEHWRQALIQRGVPSHKCSVVMNVADSDIFQLSEDHLPSLPDDSEFRLIYHGTIVERYGLDLAIRAIDRVRHEIPKIHLTLLGVGEAVGEIKEMIRQLSLENHVTIIHKLYPAEQLPEIIRTAHAGIVPYRNDVFTDGLLPTKLMEYSALGLPAIASGTTAMRTHFSEMNVEFFEPGNVEDLVRCINLLHGSPQRLMQLARNSQEFNRRYNWAKISAEYVALVDWLGNTTRDVKGGSSDWFGGRAT